LVNEQRTLESFFHFAMANTAIAIPAPMDMMNGMIRHPQ
jgi:hypothetical protein